MAAGKELDLLGFTPEELKEDGRPSVRLVHPDDLPGFMETIEASSRALVRWHHRYRVNHPTRGTIWVEGVAQPERLDDGSTLWHGYVREITERIEEEEARAREEKVARQRQRLESLGVMAGGVAHDFNNVLMSILGHAEIARDTLDESFPGDGTGREVRESLVQIAESARHAAEVCRQMLTYAGEAPPTPEEVDLPRIVTEAVRLLRASIAPKIEIEWTPPPAFPPVMGDPGQLRQVALNLILNAAEAMGRAPGSVRISLDEVEDGGLGAEEAPLTSESSLSGPAARLVVEDTGEGMSEETLARIFEPFFTTKFTGRGLGLAATLGIVRAHRGSLQVHSRPGEGSTFVVTLPLAASTAVSDSTEAGEGSAGAGGGERGEGGDGRRGTGGRESHDPAASFAVSPAHPASPEAPSRGRVLIVDDEPALRKLGERILGRMGFETEVAIDGVEALERFEEGGWDLVLLDLMMPRMDGAEALRRMREVRPEQPVLIVSGYGESHLLARLLALGPVEVSTISVHGEDARAPELGIPKEGGGATGVAEGGGASEAVGVRFLQKPYTTTQLRSAVAATLQRDL